MRSSFPIKCKHEKLIFYDNGTELFRWCNLFSIVFYTILIKMGSRCISLMFFKYMIKH
jgi:hypothetical protein